MKKLLLCFILLIIPLLLASCAPERYDTPCIYVGNIERSVCLGERIHEYRWAEYETGKYIEEIIWSVDDQEYKVLNKYFIDYDNSDSIFGIKQNYIVMFSVYPGRYDTYTYDTMKFHKKDVFAYLNDTTGCVDILYESEPYERVFYGTNEYVILYNWIRNEYQYMNLETGEVYKAKTTHIKKDRKYDIRYNAEGNIACVQRGSIQGSDKVVDVIEIE